MPGGRPKTPLDDRKQRVRAVIKDMVEHARLPGPKGLESALKRNKMNYHTFNEIINLDEEIRQEYARARDEMMDIIAAETLEIADAPVLGMEDGKTDNGAVAKQRLQIDTRKWLLSKLAPRKYGDRIAVAGDNESPLKVNMDVGLDATKLPTDVLQAIMSAKDNDSN